MVYTNPSEFTTLRAHSPENLHQFPRCDTLSVDRERSRDGAGLKNRALALQLEGCSSSEFGKGFYRVVDMITCSRN